jgi:predicted HTH transcriptional regulator
MKRNEKNKIRALLALKNISKPVILDKKLLTQQTAMLSNISSLMNNDVADLLIGVLQVLEIFEWLPKGEYDIKVKIE